MNTVLSVCPTCAWPILEEVGQCLRCRPLAPPEPQEDSPDTLDEVARSVTGQMPSMAVFSETQQVSSAEKRTELAWREAQLAAKQRHRRERASRRPTLLAGLVVVVALIAAAVLLTNGDKGELTDATPANELPWRVVAIGRGATVELPGEPVASTTRSEIGTGSRVATSVPGGVSIAVTVYRVEAGMRGAGAAAMELLQARAVELGDDHATGRIQQSRDRWGQGYDLSVVTDQPIARLRAIVAGSELFLIEVSGSQNTRTTQIFSRVVNTLTPKSAS
jgi:hypothetical protein